MAKEVTKREDNYSQWYNNLVVKADLAENSAVSAGQDVQGNRSSECIFPAIYP